VDAECSACAGSIYEGCVSWLEQYVAYAGNTEAPKQFHWWAGATILGAALRRNVSFQQEYFATYPTLWTLVVAPSGTKKTSAATIAHNIVSKIEGVRILADRITPEALADALGEADESGHIESQGLIYAPELVGFLDKRSYNEAMVNFMLRLADFPEKWVTQTRGGGRVELRNVAVSFLGATANDLLYEAVPALALKSGFLARFICVYSAGSNMAVPFMWKDRVLEKEVLNSLYDLSLLRGEMVMGRPARDWYISFYYDHKAMMGKEASSKLRAYYERKPDHLLRLAMITSIARSRRCEFSVRAFEEALARLEEAEKGLPYLYDEIEASDMGRYQIRVLEQLDRAGGHLSHTDLVRRNAAVVGDAAVIKRVVQTLIESGLMVMERSATGAIAYRRRKVS